MDNIFSSAKDLSTIRKYLSEINKTTDDFLFLFDISTNTNSFFCPISDVFNLGKSGDETATAEEMFAIIHPSDRKTVTREFQELCNGERETHDLNFRMFNKRGETVWVNSRGRVIRDEGGEPSAVLGRLSEEAVRHLFNPLTGLWNKTKLREDLKTRLKLGRGWLMMLEIPMLADISLSHGRSFGNRLLCDVADILEELERVEETYHIDHNNFAIIIEDVSEHTVNDIYRTVSAALSDKCTIFAGVVPIDSGVFINVSQLIDSANITLKKVNESPVDGIEFFSAKELRHRIGALMLLEEMKESASNGFEGFEVLYQPQIKSGSYELYGVEALLRYNSPKRGCVFPDEFIPILEQSGLIEQVGMWVLETALLQCKKWRESLPSLQVAVNFSSVQFEDRRVGEKIVDALKRAELPGSALTVELTESVQLGASKHYYNLIQYIKAYGVRFSIDDFGTGYSNLGYLKQLDISEIKIDRSFVSNIESNSYNYRLISNVLEFAKTNSISACCEGVETARELSILEPLNADIFQGYLFDKPCSADEIYAKYIDSGSQLYKERVAAIEEILRFKEQFGAVHFDAKKILGANSIGLWVIRIDKNDGRHELHVDAVMANAFGISERMSSGECYDYWYSRISESDRAHLDTAVYDIMKNQRALELSYTWEHPENGNVKVLSSGICSFNDGVKIVLEGIIRIDNANVSESVK